ncbi:MAG: hypothetical protein OHK0039_13370 [Bacteroidia bacterium]
MEEDMEENFSLETNIEELRRLVEQMQKGVSDFDKQVALFRRGMALIQQCRTYLDASELQVKQLIDGSMEDFAVDD